MAGKVSVVFATGGVRGKYPLNVISGKPTDACIDQTATGSSVTCKNAGASAIVAASGDVAMVINHGTADTDDIRIDFGPAADVDAASSTAHIVPAGSIPYFFGVEAGDVAAIKTK